MLLATVLPQRLPRLIQNEVEEEDTAMEAKRDHRTEETTTIVHLTEETITTEAIAIVAAHPTTVSSSLSITTRGAIIMEVEVVVEVDTADRNRSNATVVEWKDTSRVSVLPRRNVTCAISWVTSLVIVPTNKRTY